MPAYDFEKLRVLVVDDNSFMVTIIRTLLETMGIRNVRGLGRGASLLSVMKDWRPDVMIVDHVMAPKSGLELIREVRERVPTDQRFIPIVLMTAQAKQEVVVKARFWAGADAVLVKPMSARRLFNCLVALYESDRTFVRTKDYFGPDRRVRDRPFEGAGRRADDRSFAEPTPEEADGDVLYIDDGPDEPVSTAARASA